MFRPKLIFTLIPIVLTGCFDNNAKQCSELFNDQSKQSLAIKYCEKSANEGSTESQMLLGKLLLAEGDIQQAVSWLEKSAGNNAEARFILGTIYETDKYHKKDEVTSLFYYRKGCELGNFKSCERVNAFEEKQKLAEEGKVKQKLEQEALVKRQKEEQKLAEEKKVFELEKANEQKRLELERKKLLLEEERIKALNTLKAEINSKPTQETNTFSRIEQKGYLDLSSYTGKLKFYNGLSAFNENGLYGFVDPSGKIVIPPKFKYAGRFSRERAAVQSAYNDLWGFIDTQGNYITKVEFCTLGAFSERDGLAGVYKNGYKVGDSCQGGKWGFIDTEGRWVIDPVLDKAERFINGKAKVVYNGVDGYINRNGQWVEE